MSISVDGYEKQLAAAVSHYWRTLHDQSKRQQAKDADRGRRASVTGGKQMDGFCRLVEWALRSNGLDHELDILYESRLEIPGFFRASKKWDMLILSEGRLLAALEFKSQRGPSFGNNLNNRNEEAIGTAVDLSTAHREGAYGLDCPKPWIGWVMLLEECERSTSPVSVKEPHFPVFPEYKGASYAQRYEIHLKRLLLEGIFDATCLVLFDEESAREGEFHEPSNELSARRLLASLVGHTAAHLAAR